MRISVLAVGRLKAGPERILTEDYLTRLKGSGPKAGASRIALSDFAESRAQTADQRGSDRSRVSGNAFAGAGRFNEQQTIAVDYENWATD